MSQFAHISDQRAGVASSFLVKFGMLAALAVTVAMLVFTSSAAAHTLTHSAAKRKADSTARYVTSLASNPFTQASTSCRRLFDHQYRCDRSFAGPDGDRCTDRIVVFYRAHNHSPNYEVFANYAPEVQRCA